VEREVTDLSSLPDVDVFDENSGMLDVVGCLALTPSWSAVAAREEVLLRGSIASAEACG